MSHASIPSRQRLVARYLGALAFSAVVLLWILFVTGCHFIRPSIRTPQATITAPADAGTPATVKTGETKRGLRLPANTQITRQVVEAVPATVDSPAKPATELWEFTLTEPSEFAESSHSLSASTGTIDTTVAQHRIDVAERRWLLWAAIGAALGGVILRSLLPAWPSLSNGLLLGAGLLFAGWKFSEIPWWLSLCVLGVVGLLILGYKRAEWDANRDGIPDVLQKKN